MIWESVHITKYGKVYFFTIFLRPTEVYRISNSIVLNTDYLI